ncbi:MAG: DUF1622 domain-containing protein [Verrucomicrobiota bacterium]
MFSSLREWTDAVGTAVDVTGVAIIVIGMMLATWRFLSNCRLGENGSYILYRQEIGRSILLGLEFLVAGDILRTVVVAPTMENVKVLGVIVIIRTFLSISLQVELEGRWPWQPKKSEAE